MKKPFYISEETWNGLSRKEQDFIVFLRGKKFTKEQIKRKLYITSDVGYWKLKKKVTEKIKKDVESHGAVNSVNVDLQNTSQT